LASSRSDFTLEAAGEQAHPVVLDQVFFRLDADKFKQFTSMLDAPPSPGLKRVQSEQPPWNTGTA
jgi:uncharacterized protein (DUF1778 family)